MRTDKEVQEWLKNNPIEKSEINSITKWLQAQGYENMLLNSGSDGRRIGDVIESQLRLSNHCSLGNDLFKIS